MYNDLEIAKEDLKKYDVVCNAIFEGKINASSSGKWLAELHKDFAGTKNLLNGLNKAQAIQSAEETDQHTKFLIRKTQIENIIKNKTR